MLGSETLEVAIGIIFIYFLVSAICAAIREGIEGWLKTRAAYLEHGIRELLQDKNGTGLATALYTHPLIYGLFSDTYKPGKRVDRPSIVARGGNLPSYIPSRNFALALMDIAARGPSTDAVSSDPNSPVVSLDSVRQNILNLRNPAVQRVLLTAIDSAQGDLNRAQANIEAWYDSSMDRVSGWYKRSTQWIIFVISLAVVVGMNINTITIADYLSRDDAARTAMVRAAEKATANGGSKASYDKATQSLSSLTLPIGWTAGWGAPRRGTEPGSRGLWNNVAGPVLGWLMTALAATMGAPFWFDMLNKVMVIRSTVKPHEKSQEEGSEDRQLPSRPTTEVIGDPRRLYGELSRPGVGESAPPSSRLSVPSPRDDESGIDACGVTDGTAVSDQDVTRDEDLPAAEGGVRT